MPRPLLVLLHGTRFDARMWEPYRELVPDAELVAVDLPGHGSRVDVPWTPETVSATVMDVVGRAGSGRSVVLAGHSLGGYVAARVAEQHPERFAALVLIGAMGDPARRRVLRRAYSGTARLVQVANPRRMAQGTNWIAVRLGMPPESAPGHEAYAVVPTAWAWALAGGGAAELATLACPVWLVWGQFDQLGIDAGAYARAAQRPRTRRIRRATHFAPVTHHAEVAAVLREVVAEAREQDGSGPRRTSSDGVDRVEP